MSGSIPIKLLIVGISGEGVQGDLSVFYCVVGVFYSELYFFHDFERISNV